MEIQLDLRSRTSLAMVFVAAMLCAWFFTSLALTGLVTSMLADPKVQVDTGTIEAAADYFINSASLQARASARLIENGVDTRQSYERTAERAIHYARRAVRLAPRNDEFRILLAAAREMNGDLGGAEADLHSAVALAPHHANVRWRLANLLVRAGKLDEAAAELRVVVEADPGRLEHALDLIWHTSEGNAEVLSAVAGDDPKRRLELAQYLAQKNLFKAAVDVVGGIDPEVFLDLPGSNQFLDALVSAHSLELAGRLWRDLFSQGHPPLIWNGGFETPIRKGFAQFDWNLSQSKFAKIAVTNATAHAGQRSLEITYQGVNTTRLDGEIRQLILTKPGGHYRLTCYAKAEDLLTPDGPQVVLTVNGSETPIAQSLKLAAGSYGWRLLNINFSAPSDARALIVSVRQMPRYSYVEPTKGTVWFDDFELVELSQRK